LPANIDAYKVSLRPRDGILELKEPMAKEAKRHCQDCPDYPDSAYGNRQGPDMWIYSAWLLRNLYRILLLFSLHFREGLLTGVILSATMEAAL
jgi:hypothetical protein